MSTEDTIIDVYQLDSWYRLTLTPGTSGHVRMFVNGPVFKGLSESDIDRIIKHGHTVHLVIYGPNMCETREFKITALPVRTYKDPRILFGCVIVFFLIITLGFIVYLITWRGKNTFETRFHADIKPAFTYLSKAL
jgi:hypothetical protein